MDEARLRTWWARPLGGVRPFLLLSTAWIGAVACASDGARTGPVEQLLPAGLEGMHVGSTVGEMRQVAPGVGFTPYDGLGLKLSGDPSGFRAAWFSTGELFPEIPPEPGEEIREIRLEGDSVGADAIDRVSRAFGGKAAGVRCVRDGTVEVHVWEDGATRTGAELTLPSDGAGKAELRLFAGRWPGGMGFPGMGRRRARRADRRPGRIPERRDPPSDPATLITSDRNQSIEA